MLYCGKKYYLPLIAWVVFCCLFWADSSSLAALHCATCHRLITGRYLKANGHIYCIKGCLEKSLPHCAACGKPCYRYFVKNGKKYCSKKCLETTLPTCTICGKHLHHWITVAGDNRHVYCRKCFALPKCFSCLHPGHCKRLPDGRYICDNCAKTAVYSQRQAEQLMHDIQDTMRTKLHLNTHSNIVLKLTDAATLNHLSSNHSAGNELGLYSYRYTLHTVTNSRQNVWGQQLSSRTRTYKDNISYTIYVLYAIPRRKLIEVLAHELGHDYMQQYYPNVKELKLKEGWAEYVASQVNILYNQAAMNRRMQYNPDKIYGDGYRLINGIATKYGLTEVKKLFNSSSP